MQQEATVGTCKAFADTRGTPCRQGTRWCCWWCCSEQREAVVVAVVEAQGTHHRNPAKSVAQSDPACSPHGSCSAEGTALAA